MCSRPNPDTAEVCQFCGARLKPLIGGAPSETPPQGEVPEAPSEPAADESAIEFIPDEDFPDWLEEEEGGEDAFDVRRATQTGSLRDPLAWLDDMNANAAPATPPAEEQSPGEDVQRVTGWLASLIGDEGEQGAGIEEQEEAAPAEELPDWLSEAGEQGAEIGEQEEPSSVVGGLSSEELPDWLSEAGEQKAGIGKQEEPSSVVGGLSSEELPDWLSEIGEQETALGKQEEAAEPISPEGLIAADTSSLPDMEIPEWLRPSGEEEAPTALETGGEDADWLDTLRLDTTEEGVSLEATPEWESAEGEEAAAEAAEAAVSPFTLDESLEVELGALESDEVPDWLTGVGETSPAALAEPMEEEEPEEEIERANLPAWLQEMKPVEAVSSPQLLPEDENAPPVSAGPLAGLRGVLPSAIPEALVAKPSTPSAKLRISEEQEAHIGLLRTLLEREEQPESIPVPPPVTSQRLLRWLVALVLFAAVAWPLFTGSDGNILPQVPPPEVQGAFTQVDALSSQSAVLVAFDYQPAFGGELEATADALLEHIMLRGAKLVAVSTQPEGLLLAEHTIQAHAQNRDYRAGKHYLNLGYIPGGVTGLSALADHMLLTIPKTPAGYPVGEEPLMEGIAALQDFSLVVVLTDDPDVARAWIEQVQARVPGVPVIMAVSAQAAPLVYPYYGGQISGLVSGLRGGAAYERQTGLKGLGQHYGGAFGAGTLASVLLILFGALAQYAWSAIRGENTRRKGGGK